MLHELWDDPKDPGRYTFCLTGPHGHEARTLLSPLARLVWTVDASSPFEAMTLYYEHQGWGTYTTEQDWDRKTYTEVGWEIDGRPARGADVQAAMLTRQLRTSNELLFARVRELLPEFGIDVKTSVLAQFFADDVDQEFGIILTAARDVFIFVLQYGGRGDLNTQVQTATITTWEEISDRWESSPYWRDVQEALMLPDGWDR